MTTALVLPLQVRGGRFVAVPSGSAPDVAQSVALLVDTRIGERRSVPEYGLDGPGFDLVGLREDEVRDAVEEWEPRAEITDLEVIERPDGTETITVWTEPYPDDEETD